METSALTKAYDYARANEHILAAGEFAQASQYTTSTEALRTLKLLEGHHRRLAELLKLPLDQDTKPPPAAEPTVDFEDGKKATTPNSVSASTTPSPAQPGTPITGGHLTPSAVKVGGRLPVATEQQQQQHEARQQQQQQQQHPPSELALQPQLQGQQHAASSSTSKPLQPPGLSQRRRVPPRDLSSSIASNLASVRGIRGKQVGQALSPSVSSDQAPGNVEVRGRNQVSKSKVQSAVEHSGRSGAPGTPTGLDREEAYVKGDDPASAHAQTRERDNDGFNRFYSSFGSLLNRISAPLAFAGLPLISEESSLVGLKEQAEPAQTQPQTRRGKITRTGSSLSATSATMAEPELSKIFSRATLRAISRDGNAGANDSFYVVPTSGHTVSYANILNFAEKEKRRMEEAKSGTDGQAATTLVDDDFVDAKESPTALSPGARRRVGRGATERELSNTVEELYLENKSLKDALDKLSQRLHAFEASAQTSHMALAESIRLMRPGSPLSAGSSGGGGRLAGSGGDDHQSLRKRVLELEDQLALALRDNEKKQQTLNKYRERWELIKAGAKARRGAQGVSETNGDG